MLKTYSFNDFREFIAVVLIVVVTIIIVRLSKILFDRAIKRGSINGNYDPTSLIFAKRVFIIVAYAIGLGLALEKIPELQIVGHSLLAGAGIVTLITGLASQQILSNILSGILIVIFKPFKLGDRIKLTDMIGTVEDINLHHFVLKDMENNRAVVPNCLVANNALINFNHTDSRCCKTLEIGIGYKSNIDTAIAIMQSEALKHPLTIDGRTQEQIEDGSPVIIVRVVDLGDSAVVLRMFVWANDIKQATILYSDLLKSIKERFDAEGIELPFPQRTISYSKPDQ